MVNRGHKPNGFAREAPSVQGFESLSAKIARTCCCPWTFLHPLPSHCCALTNRVCQSKSRFIERRRKADGFFENKQRFYTTTTTLLHARCSGYQRRRRRPGQVVSALVCSRCRDPWQDLLEEMSLWSTWLQPQWQPLSNINYTHSSSSL